jgi:uncharacterized membrane protein YcgQ (UPF0703/DUF1980 family)
MTNKKMNFPALRSVGALSAAVLLTGAALAFSSCGPEGSAARIQRNAAGTRSVTLAGTGTVDAGVWSGGSQAAPAADAALPEHIVQAEKIARAVQDANAAESVIEIKEKLFIAQTNDIYINTEDYLGRTIKLEGLFKSYISEEYDTTYCFVIRYGPGCCGNDGSAGFEVTWDEAAAPYPEEDAWVEATGILKTYNEDGYNYPYLALSSLAEKEERGAEFVSQ